jgi:hypothetical protein
MRAAGCYNATSPPNLVMYWVYQPHVLMLDAFVTWFVLHCDSTHCCEPGVVGLIMLRLVGRLVYSGGSEQRPV